MDTEVFIFHHQAPGLRERRGRVERLVVIQRGRGEALPQFLFVAIARDGEAEHRADVDAGIALDAARRSEDGLDVAVQTAQDFARGLLGAEAEFHFDVQLLEAAREIDVLHLLALRRVVIVVITPLADAHLAAGESHSLRRPFGDGSAAAVVIDRDRRLMAMLDGPDDVLRSPRRVATEKDSRARGLHRGLIYDRHLPAIEFDADIALDPRERVFLANRENHVIAGKEDRFESLGTPRAIIPGELFELHADELSLLDDKALRRVIDDDLDAFFFGVIEFPGRRLEIPA